MTEYVARFTCENGHEYSVETPDSPPNCPICGSLRFTAASLSPRRQIADYHRVDFTPRTHEFYTERPGDWLCGGILPGGATITAASSKPVYGSFWRWLFRRPRYWKMIVAFDVDATVNLSDVSTLR